MTILFPDKALLRKTGEVDYFDWNYKFPIRIIQRYRFKRITRLLGNKKYDTLLEAGTGSGIFLPELSRHARKLYACDIYSDYAHFQALLDHYQIKDCNFSTQNLEHTTYKDKSFDAIVAVSVLEFVKDIPKALDEIKRILKDDGVFITICPMESNFLDFIISLYSQKKPSDEFGESRRYVGKLLEEHFKVEKKGYMIPIIGRWFPVYTHYKLKIK